MNFLGVDLAPNYPYIVAEISCNHQQSIDKAYKLIDAAKDAGANAVKIQVYTPDDMTIKVDGLQAIVGGFDIVQGPWQGQSLYELYTKTQTDYETARRLVLYAESVEMPIFASVFSPFIRNYVRLQAYKIASFELTDTFMIRKLAKEGKPMVLSTGMASIDEIDAAFTCCDPNNVVLMHCISGYPTRLEDASLSKITTLRRLYSCPIGFSDHTKGVMAGQLAVALGAVMLEKHIALPNTSPEDAAFSLHPDEFRQYVKACRLAGEAVALSSSKEEKDSYQFRRSIYAVADIEEGEAFTPSNVRVIRPGLGLHASLYTKVISTKSTRKIKRGTPLTKDMLT